MSIGSLTNAALSRREDFGNSVQPPQGLSGIAAATGTPPTPPPAGGTAPQATDPMSTALQVITTYIPTEILTLYIVVLGILGTGYDSLPRVLLIFTLATPVCCWLIFASKLKTAGKPIPIAPRLWPMWEMFAATAAFLGWAFGIPNSPITTGETPMIQPGTGAIVVLVTSTAIGLLAPLFQRKLTDK